MEEYQEYKVWFSSCNYMPEFVHVKAMNQNDALILAQAERIKEEKDYTLHKIDHIKEHDHFDADYLKSIDAI